MALWIAWTNTSAVLKRHQTRPRALNRLIDPARLQIIPCLASPACSYTLRCVYALDWQLCVVVVVIRSPFRLRRCAPPPPVEDPENVQYHFEHKSRSTRCLTDITGRSLRSLFARATYFPIENFGSGPDVSLWLQPTSFTSNTVRATAQVGCLERERRLLHTGPLVTDHHSLSS